MYSNSVTNHKKVWTKEEEDQLIFSISNKDTINIIAKKHNRSENSIKIRLASIIQRYMEKGESKQKISKRMSISELFIDNLLKFTNEFLQKETVHPIPLNNKSLSSASSSASFSNEKRLESIEKKLDVIEKYVKILYKKLK